MARVTVAAISLTTAIITAMCPAWVSSAFAHDRPVVFEENRGQAAPEAAYVSRGRRDVVFISNRGLSLVVPQRERAAVFRLDLGGAAPQASSGAIPLEGRVNYMIGRDRDAWRLDIPTYGEVRTRGAWPGVDVVYALDPESGDVRFRFELAAGADPTALRLRLPASREVTVRDDQTVLADSESMRVRISGLRAFQLTRDGARRPLPARFVQRDDGIAIEVRDHDPDLPFVIDPDIDYATYIGGGGTDGILDVAVDGSGNAYLAGGTFSIGRVPYPTTTGAYQTTPSSSFGQAVVTKIDPTQTGMSSLVYSTFLGGSGRSEIASVDVDGAGRAYITGIPGADFPTTIGAWQESCFAGLASSQTFVGILGATGATLDYSTCIGSGDIRVASVAAHSTGDILIAGRVAAFENLGFPLVDEYPLANPRNNVGYLTRIDPTAPAVDQIVYSTKMGGQGADEIVGVATNASGQVFLHGYFTDGTPTTRNAHQSTALAAGLNFWVGEIDTTARGTASLVWGTFAGGTATLIAGARVGGVAVDAAGAVHVVGTARGFPTTSGVVVPSSSGFSVAFKVAPGGQSMDWATYLDISGQGSPTDVDVGLGGAVYVVGRGNSNQPSTCAASATSSDGYLIRLADDATAFEYVTPVPGVDVLPYGVAVDASSTAYVGGGTGFGGTITVVNAFQTSRADPVDGFLSVLPTTAACGEIAVEKTSAVSEATLGESITFTLAARNLGETDQADVRVIDDLPTELSLVSATPTQGTCGATVPITCDLSDLAIGQTATVTIVARAAARGAIENVATVSSTSEDGDPLNNRDSARVVIRGPCGELTYFGVCEGTTLRFCEDRDTPFERLVEVDCATDAFPEVQGLCVQISETYGFDCAVPENLTCGFIDGFGDPIYALCDGRNPGCVVDPGADEALCRSEVGPCAEDGFTEVCAGDVLLVECQVNQPVGFDCGAAGGTCRGQRCEQLAEGSRCNAEDLRCATNLTCHTNERCEDPARICDPAAVTAQCDGDRLSFCDPRSDLLETVSCRTLVEGSNATCGPPFTCVDNSDGRDCARVGAGCAAEGVGAACDPEREVYCGPGLSCVYEVEDEALIQRCREADATCRPRMAHAGCMGDVATSCLGFDGLVVEEPSGWDCATFGGACATDTSTSPPYCAGGPGARCDDPALYPSSPFRCRDGLACVGASEDAFGACEDDGVQPDAGVGGDASTGPDGSVGRDAGPPGPGADERDDGCSCRATPASSTTADWGDLAALGTLLGLALGRRRRRASS